MFGQDLLEVSTFRGTTSDAAPQATSTAASCATTSSARRTRTRCGATSPSTRCSTTRPTADVLDYHGGIEDLKRKTLRMIGDPEARYREDPVRMLRAVRFAAKLGFDDRAEDRARRSRVWRRCSRTCRPARALRRDAEAAAVAATRSPACGGCARKACTTACCRCSTSSSSSRSASVRHAGADATPTSASPPTSRSRRASCSPRCCGTRCWKTWNSSARPASSPMPALHQAMDEVLDVQTEKLAHPAPLRRRHEGDLGDAAALRAPQRQVAAYALLEHPRFRAGYDFLLLRCGERRDRRRVGRMVDRASTRPTRPTRDELVASANQPAGGGASASARHAAAAVARAPAKAATATPAHGGTGRRRRMMPRPG